MGDRPTAHRPQSTDYCLPRDGNHNVVAYISAATGAIVAEYDYGPFGELLRATGPLAKDFNCLFSTKYYDWETGLYYYGYRYYHPTTGRWLSRDPLEEEGALNLYAFVANDGVNMADYLGLDIICNCPEEYFKQNGITKEMYVKSGDRYSAKSGAIFSGGGAGEVLWDMLRANRTFKASELKVAELKKHVVARQNVVKMTSAVNWKFGTDKAKLFNKTFWANTMVVKGGVSAADAVNDLFSGNAEHYQTGCKAGSMAVLLKGILLTIGKQEFDKVLARDPLDLPGKAVNARVIRVDNVSGGYDKTLKDWVPGDRGYIQGAGTGLDAGEWIIYLGGGKFWGFGPSRGDWKRVQSLPEWIQKVVSVRPTPSSRRAAGTDKVHSREQHIIISLLGPDAAPALFSTANPGDPGGLRPQRADRRRVLSGAGDSSLRVL